VARRLVRQLGALPTVDASLTRLTADRLRIAKIDPKPLLLRAGLTQEQISDVDNRIAVQSQVAFLNVAAEALDDDTLGLIPSPMDQNRCAHSRSPIDIIFQG